MSEMQERRRLASFDPDRCLAVTKWAAAVSALWFVIELVIMVSVDGKRTGCPGWILRPKNGSESPLWLLAMMFSLGPSLALWYQVRHWNDVVQKVDAALRGEAPYKDWLMAQLHRRFSPPPSSINYNWILTVWATGFCLAATAPLWMMLASCASLH